MMYTKPWPDMTALEVETYTNEKGEIYTVQRPNMANMNSIEINANIDGMTLNLKVMLPLTPGAKAGLAFVLAQVGYTVPADLAQNRAR